MRIFNSPRIVLLATVSLLALAGCGTNRSGVDTPFNDASTGTVIVAPRGSGYETAAISAAGSTINGMTISPDAPSATFTALGSGTGFTVAIPGDSSNSNAQDAVTLPWASFSTSTQAVFPSGTQEANLTTTTNHESMVVDKFGASQDLQYSEYGVWLEGGTITGSTPPTNAAAFGIGTVTATNAMPTTGTATYTGGAAGVAYNGVTAGEFAGTAQMTANFATDSISGNITNINFSPAGSGGAVSGTMNNIALSGGTIAGNTFAGSGIAASGSAGSGLNITGANTGRFGGTFNGPSAQEVAGTFQLSGGGNQVIGSFGAKN